MKCFIPKRFLIQVTRMNMLITLKTNIEPCLGEHQEHSLPGPPPREPANFFSGGGCFESLLPYWPVPVCWWRKLMAEFMRFVVEMIVKIGFGLTMTTTIENTMSICSRRYTIIIVFG